jgi:outer membrane protein assembly factor BamB
LNRPLSTRAWLVLLLAVVALAPAAATGQEAGWSQLQGGPGHLGVAATEIPPPLKVRWRLRLPGKGDRALSTAIVASDGTGVANGRRQVVAFDSETGAISWTKPRARGTLTAPAISSSATGEATVVLAEGSGASNSSILGLHLKTGDRRWRVRVRQPVVAAPAVDDGVAYVGAHDRFVYAIDVEAGTLRWRRPALGPVFASPAVADGTVFVVSEDPATAQIRVVALAADSGKRRWSYERQTGARLGSSAPTVSGGTVYVGLGDSVLAIRASSGKELWSSPLRAALSPLTSPALSGQALLVCDDDGSLYRFDARTGERRWEFQFDQPTSATAPLVDGRFALLGLDDGDVAAVDVATGDLRWRGAFGAGPAGAVTPVGPSVLVPLQGRSGGLVALERDPSESLVRVESPTVLHLPQALVTFVAAFAVVLLVVLGAFRYVPGLRPRPEGELP